MLPARTDILLVVDDSGSMEQEQENLRQNLAAFVNALADSPVPHDFQIGVTSTDVLEYDGRAHYRVEPPFDAYSWLVPYPKGALVAVNPAARTDSTKIGDFIYDPTGGFGGPRILVAGSPGLVPDFEANVLLGVHGAGKEQPFHAVELALSDATAQGANAGFLRDGARLALIILTDEDDCSESPPLRRDRQHPLPRRLGQDPAAAAAVGVPELPRRAHRGRGETPGGGDHRGVRPRDARTDRLRHLLRRAHPAGHPPRRPGAGPVLSRQHLRRELRALAPADRRPARPADRAAGRRPSDPHMLVASVRKADGSVIGCPVVTQDEDSAQAGAVYSPPLAGRPPTLTFQRACQLLPGDRVELRIVCAG